MSGRIFSHRGAAVLVFVLAAIWVVTGKMSSVGSEQVQAGQPPEQTQPDTPAEAAPLRTVAAIVPVFTDHARQIRVSGSTQADKRAVLAARTSGVIATLDLAEGKRVQANQLVMTLEGPDVAAQVTTAEAMLVQRTRELDITQKLFDQGSNSESQLTTAKSNMAAAQAGLSQAKAAVDRLSLRAPFGGVVDSVPVELGEWLQPGTPVATILSLDPIVVHSEVNELDIGYVAPGARAKVHLVNGMDLEGTVRYVSRDANKQTRTFAVEVALPNADGKIPSGMTAEVLLFAPPVRSVVVPRSIITLSDKGDLGLRVLNADNVAHFAPVQLIDDTPEGLVLAGVPENTRIVVSGQDLVKDGDKVNVVEATSAVPGTNGILK